MEQTEREMREEFAKMLEGEVQNVRAVLDLLSERTSPMGAMLVFAMCIISVSEIIDLERARVSELIDDLWDHYSSNVSRYKESLRAHH